MYVSALLPLLLFSATLFQAAPSPKPTPQPQLPFEDWNACPFETCAYGEWTFPRELTVYDSREDSRREVAKVPAGEKVIGVTGVVITERPGVVRLDRDLPLQHLRAGDTILTYADRGEGFYAVWFKDKYYQQFDVSFAKLPDGTGCGNDHCAATFLDLGTKIWWAKIKFAPAREGWIQMDPSGMQIHR